MFNTQVLHNILSESSEGLSYGRVPTSFFDCGWISLMKDYKQLNCFFMVGEICAKRHNFMKLVCARGPFHVPRSLALPKLNTLKVLLNK